MGRSINLGTSTGTTVSYTGGGDPAALVSIVTTEALAAGDLVFLNTKSGEVEQMNGTPAAITLAAGGADDVLISSGASDSYGASNTLALSDGTIVMASNSGYVSGSRVRVVKYSSTGAILVDKLLVLTASGQSANYNVVMTELSNGNVGLAMGHGGGSNSWWILTPDTLDILYTGASLNVNMTCIQATNEGGFLLVTRGGIQRVTGTGTATTAVSGTVIAMSNTTNGTITSAMNRPQSDRFGAYFEGISSGGFILFFQDATNAKFVRFNADGTIRGAVTTVSSTTVADGAWSSFVGYPGFFARATTGNIAWLYAGTTQSRWGIVGDDGTIVLATTALGASGDQFYAGRFMLTADKNNCFLYTYKSGANIAVNYVSATGVAKGTWPQTFTSTGATALGEKVFAVPSTAGVMIAYTGATTYTAKYCFISNAGTVVINAATLHANDVGNTYPATSGMSVDIFADEFYIFSATSVTSITAYMFRIDGSTGVLKTSISNDTHSPNMLPASNYYPQSDNLLYLTDQSEVVVQAARWVRVYSAANLYLKYTYQGTNNTSTSGFAYRSLLKNKVLYQTLLPQNDNSTAQPTPLLWRVSYRPLVLLGVATTPAAAGASLVVGTRGIFNTTWTAFKTFDQSAANPKGNVGSIAGKVLSLGGLI